MISTDEMSKVSDADLRQGFAPYHHEHTDRASLITCGECRRTWCDWCSPTPAARCPYEYEHVPSLDDYGNAPDGDPFACPNCTGYKHTGKCERPPRRVMAANVDLGTWVAVTSIAAMHRGGTLADTLAAMDEIADLVLGPEA